MKRISKCAFIGCFLLFLLAAMLVTVFSPKSSYSYYENRSLARPAPLTVETVLSGEFMKSISDCMRDHSAWREKALRANTWANIHILKKPVVNQVVMGEDILLPYLPYAAMDEEKVAINALEMTNRIAKAKRITEENGGKYYYMMIPCQYTYFPHKYPEYLYNREDLTEATLRHLKPALADRNVDVVDMGEIYEAHGNPPEYSSTIDNHYSLTGAYVAYQAIVEKINATTEFGLKLPENITFHALENSYLGSRPRKLFNMYGNEEHLLWADFGENIPFTRRDNGMGVPATVYTMPENTEEPVLYGFYMGGDIAETIIDTNRPHLPKVLIYGDSFTNALESLAYYSFDEMRSLDFRYYSEKTLEAYIQEYQPDIVIFMRDYESLLAFDGNGLYPDYEK